MKKNMDIVEDMYNAPSIVSAYGKLSREIGLWESEKKVLERFVDKKSKILDLGCGAGRTTFSLYKEGYADIIGIDLSRGMIDTCEARRRRENVNITFISGDATELLFNDNIFDAALFLFNGWPTIPKRANRKQACREIFRILKHKGIYIFTTLDIKNPPYLDYWKEQRERWEIGLQDERLYEFGDIISIDRKSDGSVETFVHIHSQGEVIEDIEEAGFRLLYSELRSSISQEKQVTIDNSGDCFFYVCRKE